MNRAFTFGIVGGYGATGRAVAAELRKSCDGKFLIGGRDLAKGKALAAEFEGRACAVPLDALDARSLDDFCSQCSIIVNCAGPVTVLEDRVAQAAFRQRCHYIDAAGMSLVKERLLPHAQEIADLGLSFVVSAGWMPGITEVVPVYADTLARAKMDKVEFLTLYYSDAGEWSTSALRDAAWYIRKAGLRSPGYFRRGEWVRAGMSVAIRKVDLGGPIGTRRFCLFSTPELEQIGRQRKDCDVFAYTYLSGFRTTISMTLLALLPLPEGLAVRLVRNVFRRNRLPVGGFVVVQVVGRSQGRPHALTARLVYEGGRDYWIHGLAMATVARMVSEGKGVCRGVKFLSEAVDPLAFLSELRKAGVEASETLEPCK